MSRQHPRGSAHSSEDRVHDLKHVHTKVRNKARSTVNASSSGWVHRVLTGFLLTLLVVAGYFLISWRRLGLGSLFRCATSLYHFIQTLCARIRAVSGTLLTLHSCLSGHALVWVCRSARLSGTVNSRTMQCALSHEHLTRRAPCTPAQASVKASDAHSVSSSSP